MGEVVAPAATGSGLTRGAVVTMADLGSLEHDPRILPEMGAKVGFLAEGSDSETAGPGRVFVPAAAVRDEGGHPIVWAVRGGRLERREVNAGPVTGDVREIGTGVAAGEQVVIAARQPLREGARVKVVAP